MAGKVNSAGGFSEYDEVPMVDKAVDAEWKKQLSLQDPCDSRGILSLPRAEKTPEGLCAKIWGVLITFFLALATLFHSVASRVTKKLPDSVSNSGHNIPNLTLEPISEEELRPPSPAPRLTEADLFSSVLKRVGELEEKVDLLQAKPFKMPHEKEELLNAAVCRVDALEAELIATKKALHEALMRQEELLAYIDRQEEAKSQKKKFCW